MPSAEMTCLNPPIMPLLYFAGSSWMRVLTTSTGVSAPCVMEQQIPPARAACKYCAKWDAGIYLWSAASLIGGFMLCRCGKTQHGTREVPWAK